MRAGSLVLLAGVGVAVAVSVAGGPAGAAPRAAAPRVAAPPQSGILAQVADGPALAPADRAALLSTSAAAAPPSSARPVAHDAAPASALATDGIPVTALRAYQQAAVREAKRTPGCGLTWPLLAGIGRVESDHGRFAGAVLHSDGLSTPRVIGIPLNGQGTALIRDTDGGLLDGDTVYDRAVGPMQFIPSTWAGWGVDANNDGRKDPFNIFDAAAAAADYLCTAGRDLTTVHGQLLAILSYNDSWDYVSLVMSLEKVYATGVGITVPVLPTTPEPKHGRPTVKPPLPPVDPGRPRGTDHPPAGRSSAPTATSTPPAAQLPSSGSSSSAPGSATSSASWPDSSTPADSSTSAPSTPATSSSPTETSGTPSDPGSSTSDTGTVTPADTAVTGSP